MTAEQQTEKKGLQFSETALSLRVQQGRQYKGTFSIAAEDGKKIRGVLTSDHRRILLASDQFSGGSVQVLYGIDTAGMTAGQEICGSIYVGCNRGEYHIPVHVEIVEEAFEVGGVALHTLDDFVRLCKKDLRTGFRAFTHPLFPELLRGKNRIYRALYQGMSQNPVTYQHLEEFLVTAQRKVPVEFTLDKKERAVYHLDASQKDTLYLYLNTWGYIRLEIETRGDFLQVSKQVITIDDFIGRVYGLEFVMDRSKLNFGKNYGKIILRSVHQEVSFTVEASRAGHLKEISAGFRDRIYLHLLQDYLHLKIRRLDYRSWYERAMQLTGELLEKEPENTAMQLYRAYLAWTHEDQEECREILTLFRSGKLNLLQREEEAVYLYLAEKTKLFGDAALSVPATLQRFCRQQPNSVLLLSLLLDTDPVYEKASAREMYELENCYQLGCTSPFLYERAWRKLERDGALLRKLTPFYIRVLDFARRKGILTEVLLRRAAFLTGGLKSFDPFVYRLLSEGYEKWPSREVLEAICKLLMKGDPFRQEYFRWYDLAMEQDLRITRLYEYYMETVDSSRPRELPQPIRLYFVYNRSLGENKRAFLYASIVRYREKDQTSYLNYGKAMQTFTPESLRKGLINENYAVLYQEFCSKPQNAEAAARIAQVLFVQRLECQDRTMRYAVVVHEALKEEQRYPLQDGVAYVSIYGNDACILFEDGKHRRFASGVKYTLTKLMERREIAGRCMDLDVDHPGLQLYCCRERAWQMEVNGRNISCFRKAAASPAFTEKYKTALRSRLLEYYEKHKEEAFIYPYLRGMDYAAYARADRVRLIGLLVELGLFGDAFQVVSDFGWEGVELSILLKLASRMIVVFEGQENEELICLARYVYLNGKYDESILTYLRDHLSASVEELSDLWKSCRGFGLEALVLEERILRLAMFTDTQPRFAVEILDSYIRNHGRIGIITNLLAFLSRRYFVQGISQNKLLFAYLEKTLERNWVLDRVCSLALLRRYADQSALSTTQMQLSRRLLKECVGEGLRFAFYSKLPAELTQAYQIEDKVFIEHRFPPGTQAILRYRLTSADEEEPSGWTAEPLKEIYEGIFGREFLLFYDEVLTYVIFYEEEGETRQTEKRTLTLSATDTEGSTRFKLLNRMIAAGKLPDGKVRDDIIRTYLQQEAFAEHFFIMEKGDPVPETEEEEDES